MNKLIKENVEELDKYDMGPDVFFDPYEDEA